MITYMGSKDDSDWLYNEETYDSRIVKESSTSSRALLKSPASFTAMTSIPPVFHREVPSLYRRSGPLFLYGMKVCHPSAYVCPLWLAAAISP